MFSENEFLQTVVVQIKTLEDLLKKYQVNQTLALSVSSPVLRGGDNRVDDVSRSFCLLAMGKLIR